MGRRARLFFVRGSVSTEAGLYGVGPGEGVDDRLERLRANAILVAHPMVIEVAHVQLGRVPVVADELVGPQQRVEVVVPGPALGGGSLGLSAMAEWGGLNRASAQTRSGTRRARICIRKVDGSVTGTR